LLPANVTWVMSVNADPKPGRWILPLVIVGMIAFTYYFVRELPEASPDTTTQAGNGTTTTLADDATTTTEANQIDAEVQAYLDAIDEINAELRLAQIELTDANNGFDADPRTVEYPEAVTRFTAVVDATNALVTEFDALTAPVALESHHTILGAELTKAANAAQDALDGLRSSDPGGIRRNNVTAYVDAATAFDAEVTNLHTAAGG